MMKNVIDSNRLPKQAYTTPAVTVERMEQEHVICSSDWEVMPPGIPNDPVGVRESDLLFNGL